MTIPVVVGALLFWLAVFLVYFTSRGTTPAEFFFGRLEALPDDLGRWQQVGVDPHNGLLREERSLLADGQTAAAHLLRQVRFRDPTTQAIVHAEPDRRFRRRRVRSDDRASASQRAKSAK